MKRVLSIFASIVLMSFLLAGCQTAQTMQESVTSTTKAVTSKVTSKVKSMFYDIDEKQYAQVPEENREGVDEAEKVLMEESEKLKLAQMKAQKAELLEECRSYEMAVSKKNRDIAQVEVNRLKWEAIDRSNIGNRDENLKNIASLKEKKGELLEDIENIRIEMKVAQSKIDSLDREINFLEGRMGGTEKTAQPEQPEKTEQLE